MTERELFEAALELPPADRAAFLDRACGPDAALQQRVEALLGRHDHAGSFLERPAAPRGALAPGPAHNRVQPQAGAAGRVWAGRYTLLERIGEGGRGSVWLARQAEPVKRPVAVKLIKAGMDSRAVLARFEA